MRFEVLCRNEAGEFESIGSVLLPYGADTQSVRTALEGLDVYPRPKDTLHWLDEDLAGAAITNSRGGTIVILREVSAYRARTGYRPNDEPELDWDEFLEQDPYRGAVVETGRVVNLYSRAEHSPLVNAALYLETDYSYDGTTHQFVAWKRTSVPRGPATKYEMLQIPLNLTPSSVLDMGRWSQQMARAVRAQMQARPVQLLGWNDPFMAAAGASNDPMLSGLFYFWYLEATDWSFEKEDGGPLWKETWQHASVDQEWLVQAYAGLLNVYESEEGEVTSARPGQPVAPEPEELELLVERSPKYRWTEKQISAMRRAGLRPGYDFNGRRER